MALTAHLVSGHPIPDVPVRGIFHSGGEIRIEVEVDPRCFAADPINAPYVTKAEFDQMSEAERAALLTGAATLADKTVSFHFQPMGRFVPEFEYGFSGKAGAPLANADDPVVVTGRWNTRLAAGLTGYRVDALSVGELAVVVINEINGQQVGRINVLFPGESSYVLDLTGLTETAPATSSSSGIGVEGGAGATFISFLRQGFIHVAPLGLDHILFVLGLFLLSRELKPLLWQVTMFTLAHTITLGLATLGGISAPAGIVEPVIAASITVVAIENVFHTQYSPGRLAVVFAFGLVHGLGFAGALQELALPTSALLVGLLGFNIGVEFGQLAIIALVLAATFWVKPDALYRKTLAVPGSLIIAGVGAWWTVERIFFR